MSTQPSNVHPIVVGIAFDETGLHALSEAVRVAQSQPGVEIHLVSVVANSDKTTRSTRVLARRSDALVDAPRQLRAFVLGAADQIEGLGRTKMMLHARLGAPADAIVQLAIDTKAELIVVGTHGRRGLRRAMLGSVATRLIEMSPCPVLVARPRDYRGLAHSPAAEPLCADCAKTRAATNGATMWCEYHSRPQLRPHVWRSSEVFRVGGHDPGIAPST